MSLQRFWDENGWTIIFIVSIVTIFFVWLLRGFFHMQASSDVNGESILERIFNFRSPTIATRTSLSRPQPRPQKTSRGEMECKKFVEFYFQRPFVRIRPDFLTNPITNNALELDVYNDELKLAVEYNGSQHYNFNKMMHQNSRDRFQNQQYRDYIKKNLCRENGIELIVVPYTIKVEDIPQYLYKELEKRGFSPVPKKDQPLGL